MRKVLQTNAAPRGHWVGDGFPVRSLFSHFSHGEAVSPFLLFDYAGPAEFEPTTRPRGVDVHPHRGFETVTIVFDGEVEHHDSTGAGGLIGPGDVQWMTAASGILHKEFHSHGFTKSGGRFEMAQLWVNLPAAAKNAAPGYQTLLAADIPTVALGDGASARVIAGELGGSTGPARTFTAVNLWDLSLDAGATATLTPPEGHTVLVAALRGRARVNDGEETLREAELATLARDGGEFTLTAETPVRALVLTGEPIDEPVVMHGPFVMNTNDEIRAAIADFQSGRFGSIPA